MKTTLLVLILLLFPIFAYNLTIVGEVDTSCESGWVTVAGLSRTTNAHVASSGSSSYKLCLYGERASSGDAVARGSVPSDSTIIFGMNSLSNSHAQGSQYMDYSYAAYLSCPVNATLRASCESGETCVLEFYKLNNSHVAVCGTGANYQLCVKSVEPDTYEPACKCPSEDLKWNSDAFIGTYAYCCGDDSGEKESDALGASCTDADTTICCLNNKCGKTSPSATCVDPGTACGSYICSKSEWEICDADNFCTAVDTNNDGYDDQFCENNTPAWTITASMTDICEGSCEQMNGIWTGKALYSEDTQNCCSSIDTGEWCYAGDTVTRCNEGVPTDCGAYCDASAVISDDGNDYTCTGTYDLDCTASGCSGVNCACLKGDTTGCYIDGGCNSDNCISFSVAANEGNFFEEPSVPYDSENSKSFAGICCGASECAFDINDSGTYDGCAPSLSYLYDADNDGDTDYCNSGTWSECLSYSCASASDCGCMGNSTHSGSCNYFSETAGTYDYSFGSGECNITNPGLACATPCDTDGNTNTREYINSAGFCVKGGGSCLDIYKAASWFGNSSLSFVNVTIDCLCSAQANCTVYVFNSTNSIIYSNTKTISASGSPQLIEMNEPFAPVRNKVNISCSCGALGTVPPTGCGSNISILNYTASESISAGPMKVGTSAGIVVTVNNIGDINLANYFAGISVSNGGNSFATVSSIGFLAAGNSTVISFTTTVPINMFKDTKSTLSNETAVTISSNVTDVEVLALKGGATTVYQCSASSDCPTACPSEAGNCWSHGASAGNFTCSLGVCCPNGHHYESGGCCLSGYNCCILDSSCNEDEWCANASAFSGYGVIWSCNDLIINGDSCSENKMCDSKNCEQTQTSTDYYCCEPIVTLTEASGECSPTASESVCKSSGCCSSSSECLSGSWCSTFGNRCVDCPVSGDEGYFNGFCANENCLGSDIDCCATDSDCDDASSASGSIHYCNSETITCETCTASMDFYCPSPECYESGIGTGDPDCCASDSDCIEGSQCVDTDSNGTAETCAPKNIGKICMGDDCGDGLTCITNYKGESRCVLDEFLIITPSSLEMKVGEIRYANVIVRDPQLLEDDYLVSLSGTQLPFVKIEDGTSTSVHIGPNQVRKMTLVVYGGRTIDASSVKIYASSKRTSGISAEKSLTLTVAGSSGSGLVLAAPGITFTQSVAILVLGGVLIWSMKKL